MDFTSPQTQQAMDASLLLFQENEYVLDESVSSWWDAFRESQNGTVSAVRHMPHNLSGRPPAMSAFPH